MKWKEIVRDYLTFTKKDRIGVIVILLLLILVIFFPTFITPSITPNSSQQMTMSDTAWMTAVKKLEQKKEPGDRSNTSNQYENENYVQFDRTKSDHFESKAALFYFDPNTLSKEGWQKLGLRDKTIQTIQNYLTKGGHFNKAGDFQKVYGLYKNEYDRLAPYIKIETRTKEKSFEKFAKNYASSENKPTYASNKSNSHYSSIDINTADTSAFIELPGIGSKLATRIVNFRDKLGGFYAIEQVRETFGLPDSTFQKIKQRLKLENTSVRKIDINKAMPDELKAHPYIRYTLANPIITYRNEHGAFASIEDLKKIMIITDEVFQKIAPYLTLTK